MCMGFLDGVKIREARAAGFDMDVVGQRYIRVAYAMLFEHGFSRRFAPRKCSCLGREHHQDHRLWDGWTIDR